MDVHARVEVEGKQGEENPFALRNPGCCERGADRAPALGKNSCATVNRLLANTVELP